MSIKRWNASCTVARSDGEITIVVHDWSNSSPAQAGAGLLRCHNVTCAAHRSGFIARAETGTHGSSRRAESEIKRKEESEKLVGKEAMFVECERGCLSRLDKSQGHWKGLCTFSKMIALMCQFVSVRNSGCAGVANKANFHKQWWCSTFSFCTLDPILFPVSLQSLRWTREQNSYHSLPSPIFLNVT